MAVVAHVSHVQRARGIGQHFQHVIFLLGGVGFGGVERRVLLPALEPFALDALGIVAVVVLAVADDGGFFFLWHRRDVQGQRNLYFTTRNRLGMRNAPMGCHPERSGRFATRSSHAVEGPL